VYTLVYIVDVSIEASNFRGDGKKEFIICNLQFINNIKFSIFNL